MLLADRGYDADWIRELAMKKGAWANIPRKATATIRSASARTFIALATRFASAHLALRLPLPIGYCVRG
jgi:transposase